MLRDGEVELSLGSAGSNRLRSAILQVVRCVFDCGMEVGDAVRAGRLHYEAETLHAEPGFSPAALDELERRGYRVVRWKGLNLYFGGAQAVRRDPATGELSGAGDPRRGGAASSSSNSARTSARAVSRLELDLAVAGRALGHLACALDPLDAGLEEARQQPQPRLLGAQLEQPLLHLELDVHAGRHLVGAQLRQRGASGRSSVRLSSRSA